MLKRFYFIFIFSVFSLSHFLSFSQCGVTTKINVSGEYWGNPVLSSDSVLLQPNWKKYAYEWQANDVFISNNSEFWAEADEIYSQGFNKVCLQVWGTDTITGDSCSNTTCNIFQGVADVPWIELHVDEISPYTFQFYTWMNTYYWFTPTFLLKFGDGDSTTVFASPVTHTYSAPGNYFVQLSVGGFPNLMFDLTTTRTVHVDNGLPNINIQLNNNYINPQCDSIGITVYTSPMGCNASISFLVYPTYFNSYVNCQDGILFKIPSFKTPGTKLMRTIIFDPNAGYGAEKFEAVISDVCAIVPDTIRGKVFADLDADGILDTNETGLYNKSIELGHYDAKSDSSGNYTLLKPNEDVCFSIGGGINMYLYTIPYNGYYCISQPNQNYNFGMAVYTTNIKGTVFIDYNQDSIYGMGDDVFKNVTIQAYNTTLAKSFYTSTDYLGRYEILVPSGTYIVRPIFFNLDSAYFFPDSISIISPTGGYYYNQNFGAYSNSAGANLGIYLNADNLPRPGFNHTLNVYVTNTGIDSAFGTVVLNYDNNIFFDSISPANGTADTVNHVITWQTGTIKATHNKIYRLYSKIPVSIPLGSQLSSAVTVIPDSSITENDSLNNFSFLNEVVVGSFDPNDKLVSPIGVDSSGTVHHNQRLHYRINFQNTGTASAINVIVQDVIDLELDLSTFIMENSSHPCDLFINERVATWKFFNINLPDSNFNEPQSHGYIEYSILPVQGLPDGTVIENSASIYFDFNEPVITNTVLNTLQTNIVSVPEAVSANNFIIYPVPASDYLTIISGQKTFNSTEISILDLSGRVVKNFYAGNLQGGRIYHISLNGIAKGIYLIRIKSDDLFFTSKIVKN